MKRFWFIFILFPGFIGACDSPSKPKDQQVVLEPTSPVVKAPKAQPPTKPAISTVQAPFLWKVSHDKGDSYILGTIHQSVKPDDVVNEALYAKIDASKIVVFESDVKALEENRSEAMRLSHFPEGKSLKGMLGEKHWETLKTLVELPSPVLDRFKPWLIITLITLEKIRELEMFLVRGMDDTLRRYAELQSLKIGFLEEWRDVIRHVDKGMTVQHLREVLDDHESIGKEFLALRSSYMAGDEKEFLKQFKTETVSDKNLIDVLLVGRNKKWMEPLTGFLNAGNAFILVGAGHLVGEQNLVTLLKAKGFKIERVKSL